MASHPIHFSSARERYRADTCAPVIAAAQAGLIEYAAVVHGAYPGFKLANGVLPELRNAGFWNVLREQSWGLDWHRNEGIEFTYLTSGQLHFGVDDQAYRLRPGHLTITRPWQRHRVGRPHVGASHLTWVILDVGVRRPNQSWSWPSWLMLTREERHRLSTLLRHNELPVWRADKRIADSFERIGGIARAAEKGLDRTRLVLAMNELLKAILDMFDDRKIALDESLTSSERTVELFLAELKQNPGQEWSVDTMAEQCGLRRSQFTTHCHQLTNMSPSQYLIHCRVEAAAELLRSFPGRSITEIAMECGFNTSQYFATAYRRLKGRSPREGRAA